MGEDTTPTLDPGTGGGSDGSLNSAIRTAAAFNTSWRQAITEIAGQINAAAARV